MTAQPLPQNSQQVVLRIYMREAVVLHLETIGQAENRAFER